ncbi:MAG TPA: hypothetical protein VF403_02140, partial [Kofleriaceae bacterium]
MSIVLFSMTLRIVLAIIGALFLLGAVVFVKTQRPRLGAVFGVGALAALGALLGEGLVTLTVWLAAPSSADFNEYRWVFL